MKQITLTFLMIGFFWFSAERSFAQCMCMPDQSTNTQYKISDVVFVGKVIETNYVVAENKELAEITVKFEVEQVWKQNSERFVTVKVLYEDPKIFKENEKWLIYARKKEDGKLWSAISCCTRTRLLSIAAEDLKTFEKMGEKPKNIIEKIDEQKSRPG